ncbi:hypothetical protein EDD76_1222 [Kineothrix alysoides]|uniref:NADPH-dependent FMN reductase n=1 Tax=Kineothrix alysoides TaxID=1469948 RepID=A0A4R1QKH4_9FIRM|nr:hypothetical protein [Kineothrix alysoides]TCL54086.1 hypothetical protein EDD76_1222 [Kineothrix alysoides]
MKTIILNGSPKGNVENCGSYILARAFANGMSTPCEVFSIAKENRESLMEAIRNADNVIVITPNYIHSIPAGTLDFLYALPPSKGNQTIGFIIQAGYPESSESAIICRYLERFAKRLGYTVLGAIAKGECAGLAIVPERFKKLQNDFSEFGALFEQTGRFDESFISKFAKPVCLTKFQTRMLNASVPISNYLGWNKILKTNNCYEKRFDMPYLEKN